MITNQSTSLTQKLLRYKWWLLITLLLYLLLSWIYFGIGILGHPDRLKGMGTDPILYLWYLRWWPYAISHHLNPFISQWVWAPSGYNMAKMTSVLGLYLLSLPLQLFTDTIGAYNILTIFAPGLAAWTMCLLCFYLTRRWLPAWIGGYLFGFSAYMIGQTLGHANLTVGVFLLPLIIGLIILYLEEKISSFSVITIITATMTLLFLISAEIAVTFSACLTTIIIPYY
ncbi:MAG: hypothetical protein GY821_10810 [Gammaproteobacteria bacterium]|nr:hypothetical protein [Gammaproteobacteria bacterium]